MDFGARMNVDYVSMVTPAHGGIGCGHQSLWAQNPIPKPQTQNIQTRIRNTRTRTNRCLVRIVNSITRIRVHPVPEQPEIRIRLSEARSHELKHPPFPVAQAQDASLVLVPH
jgi:hypothetical protein